MPRQNDPLLTLPDKTGVLYVRLYQRMRALIMQGAWPPGMRLPSSRRLADDLQVSRNTASLALDQLMADGWIETRSRAGTFV
ncbi:MAG TPA: winged helix-turn-helix domain-containing protein, partial [Sphingomicrobium sp.]|nr:winged helix-turn-helix domain-containing protein [Sphingomicrobium sp.]